MKDAVTASDALGMTALKAGGLGELAAVFGASLATDDTETVRLFGELGFNLFTYAQLVDDLRDAFPSQGSSSDWEQGKKTLPLLFFRNSLREKRLDVRTHDGMMPAPTPASERVSIIAAHTPQGSSPDVTEEYDSSGAQVFGAIVAETFLNWAKDTLEVLKGLFPGTVEQLEQHISSLEITVDGLTPASRATASR